MHHFWHIMLYYFKKGINTTETQRFVQYGEGAMSGLLSFVLEISHWAMLHDWVDQLKLIAIKSRH